MPAPALAVGDIMQVTINGTCDAQKMQTTFNYTCMTITGAYPYLVAAGAVGAAVKASTMYSNYLSCLPTNYSINSLRTQRVSPSRSVGVYTTASNIGAWPGASCDQPGTASTIWRLSDTAGRNQRSSLHIPALPGDAATSGSLTTAFQLVLGAFASSTLSNVNITTGLFSATFSPIIAHRKNPLPWTYDLIWTVNVNTTARTERRRVLGYGK